jgi:hypothetical protein
MRNWRDIVRARIINPEYCSLFDTLEELIPMFPEGKAPDNGVLTNASKQIIVDEWLMECVDEGLITIREYTNLDHTIRRILSS